MGKEQLFGVIIKSFGIYFAIKAVGQAVFLLTGLFLQPEDYYQLFTSKIGYLFAQSLAPIVNFILSYFLIYKTGLVQNITGLNHIVDSSPEKIEGTPSLKYSFVIKIMGLYFFITAVSSISAQILKMFISSSSVIFLFTDESFLTVLYPFRGYKRAP